MDGFIIYIVELVSADSDVGNGKCFCAIIGETGEMGERDQDAVGVVLSGEAVALVCDFGNIDVLDFTVL